MKFQRRPKKFFRQNRVFIPVSKKQIIIPYRPISAFLIIILIITSVYLIFRSDIFIIKNLDISSSCVDKLTVQENTQILGTSYFYIDPGKVEEKLKKQFLCIKTIDMVKKWPDQVKLTVDDRQALAQIQILKESTPTATGSAEFFLIDDEGLFFEKTSNQNNNLPTIILKNSDNFQIGHKADNIQIKNIISILNGLKNLSLLPVNVQIEEEKNILVNFSDQSQFIFASDSNPQTQLTSLQLIVKHAKIENKRLKKVDLRFNKPVITFL